MMKRWLSSRNRGNANGFTLIEVLVVFTLIALLLTIAVPSYLTTVENSREKVQQQNLATIRDALDKFRADQGRFPVNLSELVSRRYLRQIPVDPVSGSVNWRIVARSATGEAGIADVEPPDSAASASTVP